VAKKEFPTIHFYDQDFVDIYEQTWAWIQDYWQKGTTANGLHTRFFVSSTSDRINQFDSVFSTFFLVYSNRNYPEAPQLDNFYNKQEPDGAIRSEYSIATGKPILTDDNPEGVAPPLFAWAEYNLYHKIGNKKRIRDIMPVLEAHFAWLENTFRDATGMYVVPLISTTMRNAPRQNAKYLVDFNTQQAMNAHYMAELGHILNDKDIEFRYRQRFFSLKTRVNQLMWNEDAGFYLDLDEAKEQLPAKTIAGFWPLLTRIPNEARVEKLIAHLRNPDTFGTENPFPSLAANEPEFSDDGMGYCGSVFPPFTFFIVKGLEIQQKHELAREFAIRHLYYMLDTLHPEGKERGSVWEAYKPLRDGKAEWPGDSTFPREMHLPYIGLSTITLMIENVVGLEVSLPRKTVRWTVPTLEIMGIENLSLKRNTITILSKKSGRGWEIRHESEKLYYFTLDLLGDKTKTLPIPSGKCSMLVEKL